MKYFFLIYKNICNVSKMHYFFFHELQLITILLLIRNSYTSWSTWFISLKLCARFPMFDSVLFLLNFVFPFSKRQGLLDFKNVKIPFRIKKVEKPDTVLVLGLSYLSCNKKLKNSMISAWVGAPKN